MFRKIIKLLCIILCMLSIYSFSADSREKTTAKSDRLIIRVSEGFLGKKLSKSDKKRIISKYVVVVRKGAHMFLYFLLAFFTISFLREFMMVDKTRIIIAMVFVFLYACGDEIHQLFIPGRSGEIGDVLIDTIGGLIGIFIYYKTYRIRRIVHE